MKTGKRILCAVAALVCTFVPAVAQISDARVSLRVEGRALSEVVQYLREQSGTNIVVVEAGETPISLDLTDVPWREALDLASEPAHEPWGWNWLLFTPATLMKTMEGVGYTISHPCTVVDGRTFVAGRRDRHTDLWRAGLSVRTVR